MTLSDRARRKLVELAGPCYCEETDTIRLVGKRYEPIERYNSNMYYIQVLTLVLRLNSPVEINVHIGDLSSAS